MHYVYSESWGPFFTDIHTILRETSFSDSEKIIIWYKFFLLHDIFFQKFVEHFLTHSLFKRYWSAFETLHIIYTLKMLVGALWKQSTYTLQWLLVTPLKA